MTWIDDDPNLAHVRRDWPAIVLAARARLGRVITLALLASVLCGAWRLHRDKTYRAHVVLSFTEVLIDEKHAATSDGDLVAFVSEAFLTRVALAAIMETHGLYPELRAANTELALERLREDITITVGQNYFAPERAIADSLRSARLIMSYGGPTPERALAVVRDLAARLVQQRGELRRSSAHASARALADAAGLLRSELLRAKHEQASLNAAAHASPVEVIRMVGVAAHVARLERELGLFERDRAELELKDELEGAALGMRFELVDPGQLPSVELTPRQDALLFGGLALFLAIPLAFIGVGALHGRTGHARDVERVGLKVLATIPPLGGRA